MRLKRKSLILIGSGGHARVVTDLLSVLGYSIHGIVAPSDQGLGHQYLGSDEVLDSVSSHDFDLVMGIGTSNGVALRNQMYLKLKRQGFIFPTLIHPSAVVSERTKIEAGVQIMAGAVIQSGTTIDENVIINTRASLDHDCKIGFGVHICPGAILCGNIKVGPHSFIGAGAVCIPDIEVGEQIVVGAAALVNHSLKEKGHYWGIPAKRQNEPKESSQ
jgi:sugar O-acyltransferase (sialic acid O-acetyltransferase NeuD family)